MVEIVEIEETRISARDTDEAERFFLVSVFVLFFFFSAENGSITDRVSTYEERIFKPRENIASTSNAQFSTPVLSSSRLFSRIFRRWITTKSSFRDRFRLTDYIIHTMLPRHRRHERCYIAT